MSSMVIRALARLKTAHSASCPEFCDIVIKLYTPYESFYHTATERLTLAHFSVQKGKLHPGQRKILSFSMFSSWAQQVRHTGLHPCLGPEMAAFSLNMISPAFKFFVATMHLWNSKNCTSTFELCASFLPSVFLVDDDLVRFALAFVSGPVLFLVFLGAVRNFATATAYLRGFRPANGANSAIAGRFRTIHDVVCSDHH